MSRDAVIAALCAPALAAIVDLVLWVEPGTDGEPVAHAANHLGRVRLRPGGRHEVLAGRTPWRARTRWPSCPTSGRSPRRGRGSPPTTPTRMPRSGSSRCSPTRTAAPTSPIVHTPRHYFPDEGGHHGEHGSLDVIQSRAPLVLAGAGVRRGGYTDEHARLVDVGPTLAHLAGVPDADLVDGKGDPLDGQVLTAYLEGLPERRQRRVVGILWDGAHCSDLLHLAEAGELPGVARLVERGVALRGGAVAQFPSVTLTNHTSILTGIGPGRHGVMGNVYYDRATGERVVPNDESTWHRSAEWLHPQARTVFEMVNDHVTPRESPRTASVDEAIDRGADYATMQIIRASGNSRGAGGLGDQLPDPHSSPFVGDGCLPRRRLLPVGRAGRRPRPAADAPAVGGPGRLPPCSPGGPTW